MLTHGAWPFAVLSFHHPDSVAQIGGKLELLALDCPTQSFLQLPENRCAAERAATALGRWRRQLLLHRVEEIAQRMLRDGHGGLHPALRRAFLAQMLLPDFVVHDGREMDGRVAFPAMV